MDGMPSLLLEEDHVKTLWRMDHSVQHVCWSEASKLRLTAVHWINRAVWKG
jgi:hypothetical protein